MLEDFDSTCAKQVEWNLDLRTFLFPLHKYNKRSRPNTQQHRPQWLE